MEHLPPIVNSRHLPTHPHALDTHQEENDLAMYQVSGNGGIKDSSTDGEDRTQPTDLYEKLASISDLYDSKKEFVGYVDPVVGVVLVERSTLIDEGGERVDERATIDPLTGEPEDADRDTVQSFDSLRSDKRNSTSAPAPGEAPKPKSPTPESPTKKKTLHQLAYEKKNGKPLPDDDTQPPLGFGIRAGKLLYCSTTINAFRDEHHTERREMRDFERDSLQKLLDKLNESEKKSKVCVVI